MSSERGRRVTAIITAIALAAGSMAGGAGKLQKAYAVEESGMTTEAIEKLEENTEEEETTTEGKEQESNLEEETTAASGETTEETEKKSTGEETETAEESTITETETESETEEESAKPETGTAEHATEKESRPSGTEGMITAPSDKATIWSPTMQQAGPTETQPVNVTVPIYSYDIVNVIAPVSYVVAFNPYRLPVKTGENMVSSEQVLSKNYGIINKSSRDMLVEITLIVEDLNGGKITFVRSPEEARNADKDVYAVYLSAVPADDSGIYVDGSRVNKDTLPAALADVAMRRAEESAVPLGEGSNQITFRLSRAMYEMQDGADLTLGNVRENELEELFRIKELADDGSGAAAFTFDGVMNEKADWTKLKEGIRISVIYTYEPAWDERVLPGTGGMVDTGE